jgi:hypothetical protein
LSIRGAFFLERIQGKDMVSLRGAEAQREAKAKAKKHISRRDGKPNRRQNHFLAQRRRDAEKDNQ